METEVKYLSDIFYDAQNNQAEKSEYENDYGEILTVNKGIIECQGAICGVILPDGTVVSNGDDGNSGHFDALFDTGLITISFRCLGRFLAKGEPDFRKAAKYLATGKAKVLDCTEDNSVLESDSPNAPAAGYTLLNPNSKIASWHRPASVLVQYNQRLIIFGQDEGSYFGSEIPHDDKVNTIDKAFKALMPKSIRNRKDLIRQGEWFLVPITDKQVPKIHQCVIEGSNRSRIWLQRDSHDSACHFVDAADIRVANDTVYVLNGSLEHEFNDHEVVYMKGWAKILRNTAILSYSEEGVD